jgi:glycosyltransferase involved in cell wall biosynthesis
MRHAHAVLVLGPSEELAAISPVQLDLVKFVYSGNLGPLHGADALVAALEAVVRTGGFCGEIQLVLRGSEAKRIGEIAGIESFARVHPPLAIEEWRTVMASCAVSLVTLGTGAEHVSFPSKAWSAIACGHALIGVCAQQSDLAQLIECNDLGWIVSPEDPESLATLMVAIASGEPKAVAELARKRLNSRRFAELKLTPEALADGWIAAVG